MSSLNICVYTSDYGYGHASRDIALIRRVLSETDAHVCVRAETAAGFMEDSLPGVPVFRGQNDVGVKMADKAASVDLGATEGMLNTWVASWDTYVRAEEMFCREQEIDLIISDIAPQPFLVAENLDIPGIALSNFSWHMIFHHLFGKTGATEQIKDAYACAEGAFVLPLNEPMEVFRERWETYLLCREETRSREDMRERFGLSDTDVLVYLGSGWSLTVSLVACMKRLRNMGIKCLVSSNQPSELDNVIRIPAEDTETQDYIGMCDLVVTKPGYSTVSEAIRAEVPMLLYRRKGFAEDDVIIGPVEENSIGKAISYRDLCEGTWMDDIDVLLSLKENYRNLGGVFTRDGAEDCIRRLI
ncbi:hypothetical protein [Methanogenium sp. MK-MG]|uniref:hypothetical protein n=1 Tax=Methanogenium sp. MK-MG TaxID=2599926 RepID=UPI0013EB789C|nr:hypothetical protein [Methanogenium sp. MK-MG]